MCELDKRRVIYYTDELNDEFSEAVIEPRKIDGSYVYCRDSRFKRLTHFFWYRIVATPIAFLYSKAVFGQKTVGNEKLKTVGKRGYFLYGNHTQVIGDPFIPNVINFPKTNYVIVHPSNVSMPFLGKITPSLGALPLPDDKTAYRHFLEAVDRRIAEGHSVVIYPEAHIWPFYTKIRPFPDTSFHYPVKSGAPVFCFTNTYKKRRHRKRPRIVTYIDGPFYADESLSRQAQKSELRNRVYDTMCRRAEASDCEVIKYIKKDGVDG